MISINEIEDSIKKYPKLIYKEDNNKLVGIIDVNHTFNDEHIIASFQVEISIPFSYPDELPTVKNTGNEIIKKFGHINPDNTLCLATNIEMLLFLINEHSLSEWIEAFLIPYFFSVEYFKKYNVYPFGERKHGAIGKLESYAELFHVKNTDEAYDILDYIVNKNYRGHLYCPCGSKKSIRNCHKEEILLFKNIKYKTLLQNDYKEITHESNKSRKQK